MELKKIKTKILTGLFTKISKILEKNLHVALERKDFDKFDKLYEMSAQLNFYCVVFHGIYLD